MLKPTSLLFSLLLTATGCSTIYYNFWEMFGQEKRDLLKSNVESAKDDQDDVKENIKGALERIRDEYDFQGGDLEKIYDRLSSDYETSKAKSRALSKRIDDVEDIADDLFEEWEDEADEITNMNYRKDSLAKRKDAMNRFDKMLVSMRKVEKSIEPVLIKFNDQVLYLKHNLNARALGAFKTEFKNVEEDYRSLVSDMQTASDEADKFIENL